MMGSFVNVRLGYIYSRVNEEYHVYIFGSLVEEFLNSRKRREKVRWFWLVSRKYIISAKI